MPRAVQPTRREWLKSALAGSAILGAEAIRGGEASALSNPPPNIVFILADDLGYGDLGCYGQERIQTPNLDQLAREGMRFTQCYAGSTVCAPSRCCLMTGLHGGHARIRGNKRVPLRPEDRTVAELLKEASYATGLVGKWGLGNEDTTGIPRQQGFDEFFGYLDQKHAHNYYPEFLWRNEELVRLEGNVERIPGVASERGAYSHDLVTREALDFIDRRKEDPFFLYLAYTIPHANNERGGAEGDGMEVPSYGEYENEDWPSQQKGHAAMITRLDRDVGSIIQRLKDAGIAENTLVIFTSDNGPHKEGGADPEFFNSNGPLRGLKRDLYEGGIRVPAIAWWPGKVAAGTTSDLPWAFWDFLPTAAELAGVTVPEDLDGISLLPTLLGDTDSQKPGAYLYWEFHEGGFKQAVRKGDWKAVRPGTSSSVELYDLSQDIGETRDIAGEYPEIVAELSGLMRSARTESPDWPTPSL